MRLGLGFKFAFTVLVILVATMAANTLYFLRTSADSQEQQLVDRGRALGRLISLVSPEAILGYDYLLLNDYTREVAMQRDVVYAVIVTAQGVPISASIDGTGSKLKGRLRAAGRVASSRRSSRCAVTRTSSASISRSCTTTRSSVASSSACRANR